MTSHDSSHTQAQQNAAIVTDPVCGMDVNPATAAGASMYAGKTYYFCSTGCKRRFDADPRSFADAPTQP
ncbi:MAG TPA: YHS domain-containing protein [Ktedonobacterales bacterium]|nr:YHS domain-containing protein [Ktedonobacterales bacterium]